MSEGSNAKLQAMIARACFGKERPFDDDVRAFLAAHEIAPDDAEALATGPRRLGLYRRIVRRNVFDVIETMLARTRARLERIAPGAFDEAVAAFLDEVGPRTPHLRDVPAELVAWVAPRWRSSTPSVPPWLADYAELELADFMIAIAPRPAPPPPLDEVAPDRALVFADPRAFVRLRWAVQALADDAEPEERPVTLLVYRDAEHQARFLELTPLAASILERLFDGRPLAAAMVEACASAGAALDHDVLDGAARLLADLGERGVLLGARASSNDRGAER
jgi:hypothetical protein